MIKISAEKKKLRTTVISPGDTYFKDTLMINEKDSSKLFETFKINRK